MTDHVLPTDPLFTRLLTLAHRSRQSPCIRDGNAGIEKTLPELLSDVLCLRRVLRFSLDPTTLKELRDGRDVFITLLAPGGYEFAVGILAILALGAAASAISIVQPVHETTYYVQKARSVAVLAATSALELGNALASEVQKSINPEFICLPINAYKTGPKIPVTDIIIPSSRYVDPNGAGIVIFTSGTTGPPKGAVLRRAAISDGAMSFASQIQIADGDVLLHLLPVHHATGIWVSFFPFILSGACIEFRPGSFDPQWTWDRWKQGGLTHFTGVPTIYMRMMRHYEEHLATLLQSQLQAYKEAPSKFKIMMCGTSALPQPIDAFWTRLLQGRRIVQRYGATETGVVFNMPFSNQETIPSGSVGIPSPGVDVKLSQDPGREGEILIRSFTSFSHYLFDPVATKNAHDEGGYYKSGDIAFRHQKTNYYSILGRKDIDILKSGGYKISALDVERELLSLPYISEAMVVGVADEEFGQRVAVVVTLRKDQTAKEFYQRNNRLPGELKLEQLRGDLRQRLAGYKLPTLLRVVQGELPKTGSGKVSKKILGPKYFSGNYREDGQVQVWSSSSNSSWSANVEEKRKEKEEDVKTKL